jgi:hypothetical protein
MDTGKAAIFFLVLAKFPSLNSMEQDRMFFNRVVDMSHLLM